MQRNRPKKKNIFLVLLVLIMAVGCSNLESESLLETNNNVETPEELLEIIFEYYNGQDALGISLNTWGDSIIAYDLTFEDYLATIEKELFINEYKITDYLIAQKTQLETDYEAYIFNVVLKLESDTETISRERDYVIIKHEEYGWQYSYNNVLESYSTLEEFLVPEEDKFNIIITKRIIKPEEIEVYFEIHNNSERGFSLGWVNPSQIIVNIEEGEFREEISNMTVPDFKKIFLAGESHKMSVTVNGSHNPSGKFIITEIVPLDDRGLPSFSEEPFDYTIIFN